MRPRPPLALLALVGVLVALVSACSSGSSGGDRPLGEGVRWRSGTSVSDVLATYRRTPWNTDDAQAPRAVASPDVAGRGAVAYTVPAGGTRSELEPAFRSFREGDDYWFGFSLYLDDGFPVDTEDWQVVAQWKNSGDGSPPVSIKVQEGRFVLDGGAGVGEQWQRDIGPAAAGQRTDLVVGVHFSSDPRQGRIDAWQNGRQSVRGYRPPSGTLYPDEVSYLKTGLYRSSDIDTDGTVYYDDVVIADSRGPASSLATAP